MYSTAVEAKHAMCLRRQKWPADSQIIDLGSKAMWVCNALNDMVRIGLKNGGDWFVYMSSDAWWGKDAIARLIGHDKQVVGGWACGRCWPFKCHVADYYDKERNMYRPVMNPGERKGLEKVEANGGELLVFRRDIFEKIPFPWFSGFGMFDEKTGRLRTEDYFFAEQCRKNGIDIWVDWDVPVAHKADGLYTYKGSLCAE